MSYRNLNVVAAAALIAAIGLAGTPAGAALTVSPYTADSGAPDKLDQLNGVAVEAANRPDAAGALRVADWEARVDEAMPDLDANSNG